MPFERNRDTAILVKKSFINTNTAFNITQNPDRVNNIITYSLRMAFARTPPSARTLLYHRFALLFHPDHLETRVLDLSIPEHVFLNLYLKWANKYPEEKENLKSALIRLLIEVKNEYQSDFDYEIYYDECNFSYQEAAYLNKLRYEKYYPKPINFLLECVLLLCIVIIVSLVVCLILLVPILVPILFLIKLAPASAAFFLPYYGNYLFLQIQYWGMFHVEDHVSSIYFLMFGEEIYKQTLRETISEQELADYLRSQYESIVNLSVETNERVFAYSKAIQLIQLNTASDRNTQRTTSPFVKALFDQYDMENYCLLEQYSKTFSVLRHVRFLALATYKTFKTSLPSRQVAWTTHQQTHTTNEYVYYVKKTNRTHKLGKLGQPPQLFVTLEPWKQMSNINTVHILDNALYYWNAGEQKIEKLNYYSENLATLPNYIVRTVDSLFMLRGDQLVKLDIDTPSGMPVKSQYILMQNQLFFYDAKQDSCQSISRSIENYMDRFPVGTKIDALSADDIAFIQEQKIHSTGSWHWNMLQSLITVILRALFFIPVLILDAVMHLLNKCTPQKIKKMDLSIIAYAITSFFKLPLDIYDSFQNTSESNLRPS